MKKQLIFLLMILAGLSINESIAQSWGWVKYPGSYGSDYGNGIDVDQSGNVYACGRFEHTAYFDNDSVVCAGLTTNWDIFVAKYNSSGNLQWVKRFGGDDDDTGTKIQVDSIGNIYVLCFFQGTINVGSYTLFASDSTGDGGNFLMKLDNSGNVIWAQTLANRDAGTPRGDLIVNNSGYIYAYTVFDDGSWPQTKAYLKKLDTNGNVIWQQDTIDFGGSLANMTIDAFGNSYLATNNLLVASLSKIDNNGHVVFNQNFPDQGVGNWVGFNDVAVNNSGDIFIAGGFTGTYTIAANTFTAIGTDDPLILKCNSQGLPVWARIGNGNSPNGSDHDQASCINIGDSGNVFVSGYYNYTCNFDGIILPNNGIGTYENTFVLKYNNSGVIQWAASSGYDVQHDRSYDMEIGTNNNLYLTGIIYVTGTNNYFGNTQIINNGTNGGNNPYITVFNTLSTGVFDWQQTLNELNVFPNPVSNEVTLKKTKSTGEIIIFNSLGKVIYKGQCKDGETKIQTLSFSSGIYFLQYKEENNTANFKLLKF